MMYVTASPACYQRPYKRFGAYTVFDVISQWFC